MRTTVIGRIQCHLGGNCRIPSRLPDRNLKPPRTAVRTPCISPDRYHRNAGRSKRKTIFPEWQVENLMGIHFSGRLMMVTPITSTIVTTELNGPSAC